jgi:hypothetical protein
MAGDRLTNLFQMSSHDALACHASEATLRDHLQSRTSGGGSASMPISEYDSKRPLSQPWMSDMNRALPCCSFARLPARPWCAAAVRDRYVNTAAPPASTTVEISRLAREGALIEVEAIAVLPPR